MLPVLEADVAVVGSGVAGALVAWQLASTGLKVLVLEGGPPINRRQAVERFRRAPHGGLDAPYPVEPVAVAGQFNRHYLQAGPDLFTGTYLRLLGGTTWHWLGTAMRLLPADFELRSRYGVGVDWPFGYAELEEDYGRAERALGVAGQGDCGSPRSTPYPMPGLPATYLERKLAQVERYPIEVLPAARNSQPYEGRPECCASATCVPICPNGAKYDATVHLELAERSGARVLTHHQVIGLEHDAEGRVHRARTAPGVDVRARVFVLAAHAIETPRLLLVSRLARGSGQVGRNLMGSLGQISWALAPEPVYPFRSPQVVSGITAFRDGSFRARRAGFLTSIGNDGWPEPPTRRAERMLEEGLRGKALQQALRDHASRQLLLVSNCEQLPEPDNRVTLGELVDTHGVPRPRIHYRMGAYTREGMDEAVLVHARLLDRWGATMVHHVEESTDPAHILGTCRMGSEPGRSVVDSQLRCHEHSNLWIVSTAVFPTSGACPPTLTLAALTFRACRSIESFLRQGS